MGVVKNNLHSLARGSSGVGEEQRQLTQRKQKQQQQTKPNQTKPTV